MRTVQDVVGSLQSEQLPVLKEPEYHNSGVTNKVALAVGSMKTHMSDEGWQIMQGLQLYSYTLCGKGMEVGSTDVASIVARTNPGIVVMQDKREWDPQHNRLAFRSEQFSGLDALKDRSDIFKLTILKDSHQHPAYHRQSADEIGCHGWIIYYHPQIVKHLATYVRPEHCIRTYHSLDPLLVPKFDSFDRHGCLLSGAYNSVYPLRAALFSAVSNLPDVTTILHPGYINTACHTPEYLQSLSRHKVAICTSSIYGYSLRKIIEATACGCIVITDLPVDDVLPFIDDNLIRLSYNTVKEQVNEVREMLPSLYQSYNYARQQDIAEKAQLWYNYRSACGRLAEDIDNLRRSYGAW